MMPGQPSGTLGMLYRDGELIESFFCNRPGNVTGNRLCVRQLADAVLDGDFPS